MEAANEPEEDLYLSDIHVEQEDIKSKSLRIEFTLPEASDPIDLGLDQDGDYERSNGLSKLVIKIEHEMETELRNVGLQLWRASLFLSDFILNNTDLVRDKIVIDLGTGLGLTSFVAAFYARLVFATDLGKIIRRAHSNWMANKDDLRDDDFDFDEADLEEMKKATVILAADVVYDDLITIEFMNTVYKLLTCGDRQEKCCVVVNEKRVNFSLLNLAEGDTAYDYFKSCLDELDGYVDDEAGYRFKVEKIDIDPDKLVKFVKSYNRSKFLYIRKITSIPV